MFGTALEIDLDESIYCDLEGLIATRNEITGLKAELIILYESSGSRNKTNGGASSALNCRPVTPP